MLFKLHQVTLKYCTFCIGRSYLKKMTETKCTLQPIDGSLATVTLPHRQCIVLGRNPLTKITDKRCSRSQVEVTADLDSKLVQVTHTGTNRAGVNGLALEKKSCINLKHNDRIELVLGTFIYKIEFDPPPSENGRKRKYDNEEQYVKKHCNSDRTTCGTEATGTSSSFSSSVPMTENKWESIDGEKLLIYHTAGSEGRSKIAAFDMDGTLIITKSGKVFPINNDDWKIALPEIPQKLKSLWENGYKVVVVTNQAGIARGKVNVKDFKHKVEAVAKKLSVPLQFFISTGKGVNRKPAPGIWNVLEEKYNGSIPVNMTESFFCGDAAGRPENWALKKKKDFSLADRLFAMNLNLKFYTPEEYFLGARKAPFNLPEFLPQSLTSSVPLCEPSSAKVTADCTEVIVLVGSPGSGKSHFTKTYLVPKGYVHVNRDMLGSWQKCVSALEDSLQRGKSVVVDNTNPDLESRKRFVEVAKKLSVPCRCFLLNTSKQHAKHNNRFRELTDSSHQEIPDMIINGYWKKYQEPNEAEGFTEIVKINCVPKFDSTENEKLYKMFLLEK